MSSPIDKAALEHLAELARLELAPAEEAKLLKDLTNILAYFEELKTLDTSNVKPMAGGTFLRNAFREDTERENTNRGAGIEAFPEEKDGYLRIPPVFE
ncbi:MAG TPA: Asp-tRNA(Asn)/Glu-tRNA(Gln) amidotransferase subunit GatC [Candidatus Paceibacterota bacterium]|nr:Asp-tRNA(Asn)/Glu-tRNA(Gln) amidotransferase subunit GatC [Candidatus Paceibacterota bacterium]